MRYMLAILAFAAPVLGWTYLLKTKMIGTRYTELNILELWQKSWEVSPAVTMVPVAIGLTLAYAIITHRSQNAIQS